MPTDARLRIRRVAGQIVVVVAHGQLRIELLRDQRDVEFCEHPVHIALAARIDRALETRARRTRGERSPGGVLGQVELEILAAHFKANGHRKRSCRKLRDLLGDLSVQPVDFALCIDDIADDLRCVDRGLPGRGLRTERVQQPRVHRIHDLRAVDITVREGAVHFARGGPQTSAVVPACDDPVEAQHGPIGCRVDRVGSLLCRSRAPRQGDASCRIQSRKPGSDSVSGEERARVRHSQPGDWRRGHPVRHLVLRADIRQCRDVLAKLERTAEHALGLLLHRQQVNLPGEIVAAVQDRRIRVVECEAGAIPAGHARRIPGQSTLGKVGRERSTARTREPQVGSDAGPSVVARKRRNDFLVPVAEGAEEVETVLLQRSGARRDGKSLRIAEVLLQDVLESRDLYTLKVALQYEVHHAGDRIAAVQRRSAVPQHLDSIDCGHRNRIQIGRGAGISVVRDPASIQQDQRTRPGIAVLRSQAAQVDGGTSAGRCADSLRRADSSLVCGDQLSGLLY